MSAGPLTLGTAGHVDHGKSALVHALTGVETDRLAEERRRGLTIELGYAPLSLPSGRRLSLVDVPGHERFVRTMVAGSGGTDGYLMVIAADDGVMAQTREHAAILSALDISRGVVAVTKSDRADPAPAVAEALALLPGASAVVALCALDGRGLPELRAALDRLAGALTARSAGRAADLPARLHVDRVFRVRGAGTVATGTLLSGRIAAGALLVAEPGARSVRVRGLEVHGEAASSVVAGQRVALNLSGNHVRELAVGHLLTETPSAGGVSRIIDVLLSAVDERAEAELERGRVQVHHGTRHAAARAIWLGGSFWQLRTERALLPARGDRIVVRRIAPPGTLAGATVLDPAARRHGPSRELTARLSALARLSPGEPEPGDEWLAKSSEARRGALGAAGAAPRTSPPPLGPEQLAGARRELIALADAQPDGFTLAELRDVLGVSRREALALANYFDAQRMTVRRGEVRVLRRRAPKLG